METVETELALMDTKLIVACLCSLVLLGWTTGCSRKDRREAELQKAFLAGQQQALQQMQTQRPSVTVRGEVRNPQVPWVEGLTLTQAILTADYYGRRDPSNIIVIRQGQAFEIDPRRLLRGQEDPLLEVGDLVELVR